MAIKNENLIYSTLFFDKKQALQCILIKNSIYSMLFADIGIFMSVMKKEILQNDYS